MPDLHTLLPDVSLCYVTVYGHRVTEVDFVGEGLQFVYAPGFAETHHVIVDFRGIGSLDIMGPERIEGVLRSMVERYEAGLVTPEHREVVITRSYVDESIVDYVRMRLKRIDPVLSEILVGCTNSLDEALGLLGLEQHAERVQDVARQHLAQVRVLKQGGAA